MAVFDRSVTTDWEGGLMDGNGVAKAGTGAFSLPVTFANRIGEPAGKTSPEELMAAAHAACFAMALNGALGKKGAKAKKTHDGHRVGGQERHRPEDRLVEDQSAGGRAGGHDAGGFSAFVKDADKGCPVSNAYRGTMQIDVEGSAK